ncbi:XRE family transcriptional regulator [Calothrix sp. NIES-2100]|uniref:dynamin family protein n=1 Tax=Calothrix sp. NIES-2100 TaxID=1954172 RepID=UPI000B61F453|nr:XRE family transcriptional regulator [Calothrix sp. NIES-2100]
MNIDLRAYRQKAGMGQEQLANILGISHEEVCLYEQAPETVPMGLLIKWLQIFGVDIVTAMSAPIPPLKAIDPGTPYTELYRRLNLLNQYIDAASPVDTLNLPTQPATPNDLKKRLKLYKQKPNVVLTGGFDAGKSHMANALLGSKNLPVGYQPATRVITFIRHIEDRPEWCKDDVLIVDEDFWLKDEKGKQIIDLQRLDEQEAYKNCCIQAGSLDILQKYGVHGNNDEIPAHAAVVYLDSPLLRACNLIDLPGYSDQPDEVSKDVEKATSAAQIADVLLYASLAKGHIKGEDMIRLGSLLRSLPNPETECSNFPTLGNLFIVATHADPSISDEELKGISEKAAKRLYNNLSETVLERRRVQINRAITEADLRQRLFTFWSERPDRCQHLFDELTKILGESLPEARMHRIDREMKAVKEDNTKKYLSLIEGYETTLTNIEVKNAQRSQLEALEANESSRQQETKEKREKVYQRIQDLKQDTRTSFQNYAQQLLTVESVESIIRNKYDEKKEAKEFLAGYLVEKLQNEIEQIIKVNSDKFRHEIEDFLKSYEVKLPNLNVCINIPFDFLGAFLGGLAGLGSIGALSAWAAALGNLGGYILVAKLVSFLSALGISFGFTGGTAGVIAAVAAIGGPIVLFIGLSAAIAFGVWGLFGDSWQKRLAKQTVKYFEEQHICQKFLKGIDEYWQDTVNSFEKGADAVEVDWSNKYLPHLRDITSATPESKEHIEEIVKKLQQLTDFFAEIPWLNIN